MLTSSPPFYLCLFLYLSFILSFILPFLPSISQVFDQCSCVATGNLTARVGLCPNRNACDRIFPYFLTLSVITSFIISLGGTPGYMLLIRSFFFHISTTIITFTFMFSHL